jgi:hemolysin activation/secretion protein
LFVQFQSTRLLQEGIDTSFIINQKQLPNIIDVSATNVGLNYDYRKTNYRFNPISGTEFNVTTLVGIKQIQKNNDIVKLTSGGVSLATLYDSIKLKSYQVRLKVIAAHYFKLAKTSTLKAGLNLGIYNSPNIFRNEVFQIGGYKLLRGFDEESIYATQYAVTTAEFRSLLSLNSYLFGFVDFGLTQTKFLNTNTNNNFVSTGVGMVYETKAGLLNISLALGKRNDLPFNVRQAAKIHFGYINYF